MDGTLTGWNLAGKLGPVSFDPDARADYNATCYAMYDADNLYLAAVVVEPHPPYNTFPLKGFGSWNGDDVIIRMTSNPALKWPVEGNRDSLLHNPAFFQANFWWNAGQQRSYWEGGYPGQAPPTDAEHAATVVAVKLAPDGQGYTETIKLPWKTINPGFHPKPGDHIAFTWDICISTASPAEPSRAFEIPLNGNGTDFRSSGTWGLAVFQ
jgi:hypothetical protein